MVTIEVFYSFQNLFCYLALDEIYDLQKNYDVELIWQPFSAKSAGQAVGVANVNPDKASYVIEDAKRYAKNHRNYAFSASHRQNMRHLSYNVPAAQYPKHNQILDE